MSFTVTDFTISSMDEMATPWWFASESTNLSFTDISKMDPN